MNITETNKLRQYVNDNETVFVAAKNRLAIIENNCGHAWSETKPTFIETTEFRNGAMIKHGIDFWYEQIPYKVDAPAWERTCSKCGKKEVTTTVQDKIVKIPRF